MVWNTTQSARYNSERCCERKALRTEVPRAEERHKDANRAETPRQSAAPKRSKGLFDDGDTLLLLVLLYILVKEKTDQTLIMSLLIAMLM